MISQVRSQLLAFHRIELQNLTKLTPAFSCSCCWFLSLCVRLLHRDSRGVDILRPQRKKGPEMAEDGALGLGDAFFRLVWRKPLSESCFFVVNFGFSSSSLVRGKGDLDPLVSKVKRCFQSWGWQKSPPWHPRILAVSRTLVWIDDISWFPVLVAIAQLLGWGGREPSQLEHIAFTALWTWQKPEPNTTPRPN